MRLLVTLLLTHALLHSSVTAFYENSDWLNVRPVFTPSAMIIAGSERGDTHIATRPNISMRAANDSTVEYRIVCGQEDLRVFRSGSSVRAAWATNHSVVAAYAPITDETPPFVSCDVRSMLGTTPVVYRPAGFQADSLAIPVRVAVEADVEYFNSAGQGSIDRSLAYTAAMFLVVRDIYEEEANITFEISWFKVWTDTISDPYKVRGNAYALPEKVRTYWKENYADVPRDVAHVMTSVGYGGGGFGYFDALCNREYGFSVSSPTGFANLPQFGFTYDAYIVGHEIGHNFNAPHTHDCFWEPALDTCFTRDDVQLALGDACYSLPITPRPNQGSLLSYCANANYTLGGNDFSKFTLTMTLLPKVADHIRSAALQAISRACIEVDQRKALYLRSPRGGSDAEGGVTIPVTWAHRGVQSVTLSYSVQPSTTWVDIAQNVSASNNEIQWQLPNVDAQAVQLRIQDVSDETSFDQLVIPLRIRRATSVQQRSEGLGDIAVSYSSNQIVIHSDAPYTVTWLNMQGGELQREAGLEGGSYSLPAAQGVVLLRVTSEQREYRSVVLICDSGIAGWHR